MSKEELNTLQIRYKDLEGYIGYLKTKKLSRGLTDYENHVYEMKKEELKSLRSNLKSAKNSQNPKLTLSA